MLPAPTAKCPGPVSRPWTERRGTPRGRPAGRDAAMARSMPSSLRRRRSSRGEMRPKDASRARVKCPHDAGARRTCPYRLPAASMRPGRGVERAVQFGRGEQPPRLQTNAERAKIIGGNAVHPGDGHFAVGAHRRRDAPTVRQQQDEPPGALRVREIRLRRQTNRDNPEQADLRSKLRAVLAQPPTGGCFLFGQPANSHSGSSSVWPVEPRSPGGPGCR